MKATFGPKATLWLPSLSYASTTGLVDNTGSGLATLPNGWLGCNFWFDVNGNLASTTPPAVARVGSMAVRLIMAADAYQWNPPGGNNSGMVSSFGSQYAYLTTGYGIGGLGGSQAIMGGPWGGPSLSPSVDNWNTYFYSLLGSSPGVIVCANHGTNAANTAINTTADIVGLLEHLDTLGIPLLAVEYGNERYAAAAAALSGKILYVPVLTQGVGYTSVPGVSITGDGSGATAHAVLATGQVALVVLDNAGHGYTTATASLSGGGPSTPATLGAVHVGAAIPATPAGSAWGGATWAPENTSGVIKSAHQYGQSVLALATAMQASTHANVRNLPIVISLYPDGAAVADPYTSSHDIYYGDGTSIGWNQSVLNSISSSSQVGGIQWHFFPGYGGTDASLLLGAPGALQQIYATMQGLLTSYSFSGVKHYITASNPSGLATALRQSCSPVGMAFAMLAVMSAFQNPNIGNYSWFNLHQGADFSALDPSGSGQMGDLPYNDFGLLSVGRSATGALSSGGLTFGSADTPYHPYFALHALLLAAKPGDVVIPCSTQAQNVSLFAIRHTVAGSNDGKIAVLAVNTEPNPNAIALQFAGYTPSGSATVYSMGMYDRALNQSSIASGVANGWILPLPPMGIAVAIV